MLNNQTTEQLLEQLKTEIANELNITLGAETSSRLNGKVGAEMTKRLVELGQMKLMEMATEQPKINPNMINQNKSQQQNQLH